VPCSALFVRQREALELVERAGYPKPVKEWCHYIARVPPLSGVDSASERQATRNSFLSRDGKTLRQGVPARAFALYLHYAFQDPEDRALFAESYFNTVAESSDDYPVVSEAQAFPLAADRIKWNVWRDAKLVSLLPLSAKHSWT